MAKKGPVPAPEEQISIKSHHHPQSRIRGVQLTVSEPPPPTISTRMASRMGMHRAAGCLTGGPVTGAQSGNRTAGYALGGADSACAPTSVAVDSHIPKFLPDAAPHPL
ncbi:uncharacterized protein K444DRAFT_632374 [Hyaloscypha bicolor E]|uniref:Uncharacterized protein n=1 Tax=Hyaloscypha bicolor E TaxID=1095630 RepID=A0A2J6T2L2_9HELO|nr:uncharacterized protein K444DRAFT_632374 [Hyaloscypha bicolor E]PMD57249.1 hypothetical protein K444DRAFT_632374 [Hyaloscypha bicolor E]